MKRQRLQRPQPGATRSGSPPTSAGLQSSCMPNKSAARPGERRTWWGAQPRSATSRQQRHGAGRRQPQPRRPRLPPPLTQQGLGVADQSELASLRLKTHLQVLSSINSKERQGRCEAGARGQARVQQGWRRLAGQPAAGAATGANRKQGLPAPQHACARHENNANRSTKRGKRGPLTSFFTFSCDSKSITSAGREAGRQQTINQAARLAAGLHCAGAPHRQRQQQWKQKCASAAGCSTGRSRILRRARQAGRASAHRTSRCTRRS